MLPRILEPELMDTPDEAVDYDAMDHAQVNQAFIADLLAADLPDGPLLDLGTGTALIPIELCRQTPTSQAQIVAVDAARHMIRVATQNVRRAGLDARITLQAVDAKSLPFADASFATVMSNSIIHHLARPELVLREAWRVTRPGGLLFFRDLARPDDDAAVAHLVETYAGDANAHQQQMFEDSLRASLRVEELQTLVVELGADRESARMSTDRHWTWIATKP